MTHVQIIDKKNINSLTNIYTICKKNVFITKYIKLFKIQ